MKICKKKTKKSTSARVLSQYKSAPVAVRASIWFTICSIIQRGISVLVMPIFTRLMNSEQYGQYNIYLTWYNILVILITLNVHLDIFNKGLIEHSDDEDKFTANQAGLLISFSTFWIALYLPFHEFFNRILGLTTVLTLFMILEITGSAIVGLWSQRKRFEFDYPNIVKLTISMSVLNTLVGIVAVLITEHKAEARVIANAIIPIVVAIGVLYSFAKKERLFGNIHWWKTAVIASLPLVPHYLSLVLLNQSDKLMINYFSGATDAAIYSVAHSAGLLMTIINNSINASFVPWVYKKMKSHNNKVVKQTSNSLLLIVMFANLLLIWLAPEAVKLLAAPQYAVAVWCLVPIAMSVFFFFAYTLFVDMEIYFGANQYITIASVCAATLNILLNYVFIPVYGYIAAGYTTLLSYFVTMLLHLFFLKSLLKKRGHKNDLFDLKMLVFLSVTLIALSVVAMLLYNHTVIRLSIICIAFILTLFNRKKIIEIIKSLR